MPARKHSSQQKGHDLNDEKRTRDDAARAVTPRTVLEIKPHAALKNHKIAAGVWTEILTLQAETKAAEDGTPIITSFDKDLLIKYCLLEEECIWLEGIRADIEDDYLSVRSKLRRVKPKGNALKDYYNVLGQVNALLARLQGMDARLDGKRKLLHSLAQSVYLTPRSRAGVAPEGREPQKPKNKLTAMLDE